MRELFSDRSFIESKTLVLARLILIGALFIFFLPLVILPFYNHPFADDYFCGYNLNDKSFIDYQTFIYNNWGGRFAATFTGSLFAYHNFLYNHYYLHTLLLLALNFVSILFLVNTLHRYVLKENYKLSKRILISFLFLALEICSLPEPSTFLFWFSSTITYQLPLILTQIEIALFILLYNMDNKTLRNTCAVLLPVLVFITIGFSELFIVVQLLLFCIAFYFRWHKKCSKVLILFMILAFAAGSALLIFSPGNRMRMAGIDPKIIPVGIVAVAYHCLETLWNIFKNPLVWFMAAAIFMYANQTKQQWQHNLYVKKLSQNKWFLPAIVFLFLVACILLPVIALKGGIIPDRYVNAVACFVLLLLSPLSFIAGIYSNTGISLRSPGKKILGYFFLIIGVLCNTYIVDAYKSLIIAPVYNTILNEREAVLKQAARANKIAIVKDYNTALAELLQTKYSSSTATFQQLVQEKPPLLFFEDDLANDKAVDILKKYYRLNSITILKK